MAGTSCLSTCRAALRLGGLQASRCLWDPRIVVGRLCRGGSACRRGVPNSPLLCAWPEPLRLPAFAFFFPLQAACS